MEKKLSILIPVYNTDQYLEQCLDSVVSQTLNNIEIIIINDGSTDNSIEIIKRFMKIDNRIKLLDKPNGGYGKALNSGLKIATGRYVGIVESDDFIDKEMFRELYECAENNGYPDVVKSNFYEYKSYPEIYTSFIENIPDIYYGRIVNPSTEKDVCLLIPSIWSAIYRRCFLHKNNIYFLETPGASYQDTSFNFKVWTSAESAFFLRNAFLYYRTDNETSSVNSNSKVMCICAEYNEIERFINEMGKYDFIHYYIRSKYAGYIWNYRRISMKYKLSFLSRISKEFRNSISANQLNKCLFSRKDIIKFYIIAYFPFIYYLKSVLGEIKWPK